MAKDGIRGIEMARAERPDVILMDINLPGISGLVALGILTEDPDTASIPVIAVSANAMPEDIKQGLAAGFFRYLTKPIKVNEFMDTLDSALARAGNTGGPATRFEISVIDAADILARSILIVDDQSANVLLLTRMLDEAGYHNVTATMRPLEVCALHRKNRYDLILLDLQMPGMDGFQVMEALKTNEADGYLPVIVLTAQPGHKLRALQAGAKDFISKPFDLVEVKTRISQHDRGTSVVPATGAIQRRAGSKPCRNAPPNCVKAKLATAVSLNSPPIGTGSRTRAAVLPKYPARSWTCSVSA